MASAAGAAQVHVDQSVLTVIAADTSHGLEVRRHNCRDDVSVSGLVGFLRVLSICAVKTVRI